MRHNVITERYDAHASLTEQYITKKIKKKKSKIDIMLSKMLSFSFC